MVSDLKTFSHKECKIAAQKNKVFIFLNFSLLAGCFGIGATIRIGREMLCLPYVGLSSNRPNRPIRSSSRDVHIYVPFHVVDFEAYFAPTS